jgi:ATP-binding cassette subfamily B protein
MAQSLPADAAEPSPSPLAFQRDIGFDALSFRYSPTRPWVLQGLSLRIPKGGRVGFVGTTGSGKSTLLDIVMGLLIPTTGSLRIDGVEITSSNCRAWQAHIAHVPQSIYLADTTVAENIAFGVPSSQIDLGRIQRAARRAQIADSIESWEHGYATLVGERGVRLSGGQRQRIGIARALYKEVDVIVFDEATSALDNETESAVMDSINGLGGELTILMVAHRLSTLRGCTQVVELADGAIKRIGTYEEIVGSTP